MPATGSRKQPLSAERMPPLRPLSERVLVRELEERAAIKAKHRALEFPSFGVSWTLSELLRDAMAIAGGLRNLGLEPSDGVGIMLPNRPEYALAWWGSLAAGTIDVSINHELTGSLLVHQLKTSGVKAIVCDANSLKAVRAVAEQAPQVRLLIAVDRLSESSSASHQRVVPFETLLGDSEYRPVTVRPSDIASIRYTSGTTGPAKAVALTNSQLYLRVAHFCWLTEFGESDRLFTCFPMHHGIASNLGVLPAVLAGGTCIVEDRFSARAYWAQIRAHKATLAHIINPLVPILMSQDPDPLDRQHSCRLLWTASRRADFEERFNTRTLMFYGQSEGGIMAYTAPGDVERPDSCGKPSPLWDMHVVDANDSPLTAGEEGELVWRPRAPHIMFAGYYGDSQATVDATQNLWFHSGDQARFDSDGYLYLIGRMGDQIRRKGVNIPAQSIELVAQQCPGIVDAAAIAVPSTLGESEVKLCVTCTDPAPTVEILAAFLRANLPRAMVPRYVEFRAELPRTTTHKVSKQILRTEGINGLTEATIDLETDRRPVGSSSDRSDTRRS